VLSPPAAPRWRRARVTRPVRDLARATEFYGALLGLVSRGGFTGHEGYDGAFFDLPGGAELELATGPADPPDPTDAPLVLYLANPEEVRAAAAGLVAAGVPTVPAANPYWNRRGQTFLDPDGQAVVLAAPDPPADAEVRVEPYTGDRQALRPLFELAEDSPAQLDSYLHAGRVLVAVTGSAVVGHLQLVDRGPEQVELTNMAVREEWQGRGVGARLVQATVGLVAAEGPGRTLLVATAAADVGNLRFYQRQGFRMRSVERDAFTPATGYPPGIVIDGIPLRDRVWLDLRPA
jgi:GNAT superfamily N-acetyltransferase